MKYLPINLFAVYALFLSVTAAEAQGTGLLINDEAYNQITRQPVYDKGSKAESSVLRDHPVVNLRPFCPVPQLQGAISSCTGWAAGYGAMTIGYAIQKGWKNQPDSITKNAFSALFIYNQIKESTCDAGSYIDRAGTFLKAKGDLYSRDYDKIKNNCDRQPTTEEVNKAATYRIKDFMTLFASDAEERIKIEKTKLSLVQNKPVVIGILLAKNFKTVNKKSPFWYPALGDTTFFGAHAMVVVGYDDGKEAFEIMNSWGTTWGDGGFCWVKYRDYAKYCCYGLQITLPDDIESNQIFSLKAKLRNPYYSAEDTLVFADKDIYFTNGMYELQDETVPRDFQMQLLIDYATSGSYVYAFSYDKKRAVNVHWPRDANLDARFDGKKESAVITVPNIHLIIPDEYGALAFSEPGVEYVCILISKKPIDNLNDYLQKLQRLPAGSFIKNLYTAFDKTLAPAKSIRYSTDMIGFNNPISNGFIVPVIIQVKVK